MPTSGANAAPFSTPTAISMPWPMAAERTTRDAPRARILQQRSVAKRGLPKRAAGPVILGADSEFLDFSSGFFTGR